MWNAELSRSVFCRSLEKLRGWQPTSCRQKMAKNLWWNEIVDRFPTPEPGLETWQPPKWQSKPHEPSAWLFKHSNFVKICGYKNGKTSTKPSSHNHGSEKNGCISPMVVTFVWPQFEMFALKKMIVEERSVKWWWSFSPSMLNRRFLWFAPFRSKYSRIFDLPLACRIWRRSWSRRFQRAPHFAGED